MHTQKRAKRFIEAQHIFESLFGRTNYLVAIAKAALGDVYTHEGDPTHGEILLREALAILEQKMPAANPHLTRVRSMLGNALFSLDRYAEANEQLKPALQAMTNHPSEFDTELRATHQEMSNDTCR